MKKIVYGLILILLAGFLSGCMVGPGLKNHTVKQENQIDLIKGSRNIQGIWEAEDLSLSYIGSFKSNGLQVNGKITLATKLTHFTTMDHLRVWIHFVDSDGRIIGKRLVYTAVHRGWIDRLNLDVNRWMPVPQGSVALAFSYSGEVSDGLGGNGDRISWDFFKMP
jgi:hypothetical protein